MSDERTPAVWIGDPAEAEAWERKRRISEHVAGLPPHEPPSIRDDWERENQTPDHPGGTGFRRVRPKSVLSQLPRSARRAEIVCFRLDGRPRVVAIVYPRAGSLDRCRVLTEHGGCWVGGDELVFCACGYQHLINGAKLRSALLALPRSGKVPTLDVASLS